MADKKGGEKRMTFIRILSVALISAIMATYAWAQIIEDGLVSRWTFDDADIEGKTVKDVQGNNDGSIEGAPEVVEGKVGNALNFDGAADHVVVPSDESMNFGAGDFSICAWAKTTATTGRWAERQDIVGKGDPSVSGYALSADSNKAFFWVGGAGEVPGTSDINDGEWHHLAGVRKGADVFLYVDGQLEAQGTNAENVDTAISCIIAKHPTKGESFFAGAIDEVLIYNRALGEDEIKQIYEAKSAAVNAVGKLSFTWGRTKIE
jgi:hypothetical protein